MRHVISAISCLKFANSEVGRKILPKANITRILRCLLLGPLALIIANNLTETSEDKDAEIPFQKQFKTQY